MAEHDAIFGRAEPGINEYRQLEYEDGELELGKVLQEFGVTVYPYTYQGTARIFIRQMRQVKEWEDSKAQAKHGDPLPGM